MANPARRMQSMIASIHKQIELIETLPQMNQVSELKSGSVKLPTYSVCIDSSMHVKTRNVPTEEGHGGPRGRTQERMHVLASKTNTNTIHSKTFPKPARPPTYLRLLRIAAVPTSGISGGSVAAVAVRPEVRGR
jgi:hypothetical protein